MVSKPGIIFAYDKSVFRESERIMLRSIAPYISCVKVGLEAILAEDIHGRSIAFHVREFCREQLRMPVMFDIKLLDIGHTIDRAAQMISTNGYKFFTLHAQASDRALEAAAEVARKNNAIPLAVTALTDLDDAECTRRFLGDARDVVDRLAFHAHFMGLRGFVCSAYEARRLRDTVTQDSTITIVTPGIRPEWAVVGDQKRVMTPTLAAKAGADYIVVGRPISTPPAHIGLPEKAARMIREELDAG